MNQVRGYTMLEILLTVALISVVASTSTVVYHSFAVKNDLVVATQEVVQTARRAQILSQAVDGDSSWGISISTGSLTLFKGDSFVTRDPDYDEIFTLPTSITPSGLTEVVFSKVFGLPSSTGTLTLTSNTGEVEAVTLNSKGMLSY